MLKIIDYIYTIYQERSFTRAAEKLYVSQPALSLSIKKLEEELGYPLFKRMGKETIPTVYGEKYIAAIKKIKRIQADLENEINDLLVLKRGNIRLGSTTYISLYFLPDVLKRFKAEYPNVTIDLFVEPSIVLKEKLERDEVDLIIDNAVNFDPTLSYIPLFEERLLIGVPKAFKINDTLTEYAVEMKNGSLSYTDTKKVNASVFKDESFILLKPGNSMREIAANIFAEANISPNVVMEFDLLLTSVSYAEEGFGICMLTDSAANRSAVTGALSLYVPETKHSTRSVYLIRKKRYLSSAEREFIRLTSEELRT